MRDNFNRIEFVLVFAIFLLHFLPFLLNGDNAYIRIHDNLEGEWVWLDLLVKHGKALDFSPHSTIDNVMNGQLRAVFPTGLSLNVLLIYLFGSYWGYLTSYAILHLMAFAGMYLLLRNHFLTDKKYEFIVTGVSLCFSLVPFYLHTGVAGHPLLLYCFLNILKDRERWIDFLFIALFPLISSVVWTGFSAVIAFCLLLIFDLTQKKRLNRKYALALALLAVSFYVANFQLLSIAFVNKDFISHRVAYDLFALEEVSFKKAFLDFVYPFLFSHYHVGTLVSFPIILVLALTIYYGQSNNLLLGLLGIITVICLTYGFYIYAAYLFGNVFPLLITFKANRMIILLPLLWLLLFSISIRRLSDLGVTNNSLIVIIGCQLVLGYFANDEWLHNVRNLAGFKIKPGYKEFFAENLFQDIDKFINQPKSAYRTLSIGISPCVAQYNGFYTLDGLQAIYSLNYKKQFREIIAPELEKDSAVKNYFDAWGNRCYAFSSEMSIADRNYIIGKNEHVVLNNFDINTIALKKMKGRYIFSAVEIKDPERTGLSLIRIFESDEDWWRIYLYTVN